LIQEYYDQFGSQLPSELRVELQGMKDRLEAAKS
jgi:GTP-dependent phosphoenolpyruvate carboxykinase